MENEQKIEGFENIYMPLIPMQVISTQFFHQGGSLKIIATKCICSKYSRTNIDA